jgi:hypothetical protein
MTPDIQPLYNDTMYRDEYIAKGEHSADAMIDAIRRFCGYSDNDQVELVSIETRRFRWVPIPPGSDVDYSIRLERSAPGRGAWIGTLVEVK